MPAASPLGGLPNDSALLGLTFDDSIEHATSQRGVMVGARTWWISVRTALAAPGRLTERQRMLLPAEIERTLGHDDLLIDAWTRTPLIRDRLWCIGTHCPDDRHLAAHLLIAAADGAPAGIASLLARDLVRLCAIDLPRWGGPAAAAQRVDEAMHLIERCGVTVAAADDPYVEAASSTIVPLAEVVAIGRRGLRHVGLSIDTVVSVVSVGELLVLDVDGLYDRLPLLVTHRQDSLHLGGTDLVSGRACSLQPSDVDDRWMVHVGQPAATARPAGEPG